MICFPPNALFNERYIHIGAGTMFGPADHAVGGHGARAADGVGPGHHRSATGACSARASGIVGHLEIEIGDDVWTGHHVYITDQNHGYEDLTLPISQQVMPERPVSIGSGSWLGHGTVVLPGAPIGRHVVIGANSVVTGDDPGQLVAAGVPARVIKRLT